MTIHEFKPPSDQLPYTGERYTLSVGDQIQHEHFHRYLFASQFCKDKSVLDVACGEGYGAALLGRVATRVVGVDSAVDAIQHAQRSYGSDVVSFTEGDATAVPLEDGSIDVVVSFETLEHLEDHDAFLRELARVLRPDGMVVFSTPDRTTYLSDAEPNPFHVREVNRLELTELLERFFDHVEIAGQRSDTASAIVFARSADGRGVESFDQISEGRFESSLELPRPSYLLAVGSNRKLPPLRSSLLLDGSYLPSLHSAYRDELERVWTKLNASNAAVAASTSSLEETPELKRVIDELEQKLDEAQANFVAQNVELREVVDNLDEARAHTATITRDLRVTQTELAAAYGSISWRLTTPLRLVKSNAVSGARTARRIVRARTRIRTAKTRVEQLLNRSDAESPTVGEVAGRGDVRPLISFSDDGALPSEVRDSAVISAAVAGLGRSGSVRRAERMVFRPLISILMPTYNTPAALLGAAVSSVLAQSYNNWELVIVDDASTVPGVAELLESFVTGDERIRVERSALNGGISNATNRALELATGEFVAMLDHDDELLPDALLEVAQALNLDPETDVVYTDQEYIEEDGTRAEPLLKPDWSPTLFCGVMFVGHLLVVRRTLAVETGGFNSGFDNVQDFEFMLRVSERAPRIVHIPRVLYRWRRAPGSVASRGDAKSNIEALQSAAVTAHLQRIGVPAIAIPHARHAHRASLVPRLTSRRSVSVLVADGRDTDWVRAAVASVEANGADWVERIVICNPDAETAAGLGDRVRAFQGTWNEAAHSIESDFILAIEAGVLPQSPHWIENLIVHTYADDVASVSSIILSRSGAVEDAGSIFGISNGVATAMAGFDPDSDGYAGSLSCAREVSAVSGACALISGERLVQLGGFRPVFQTPRAAWLDLSFRARRAGLRTIVSPQSVAIRQWTVAPAAEGSPLDAALLRDVWPEMIAGTDPYHNPNFRPDAPGYVL